MEQIELEPEMIWQLAGFCLFVCGGSLTSGQLVKGSFQTA